MGNFTIWKDHIIKDFGIKIKNIIMAMNFGIITLIIVDNLIMERKMEKVNYAF